MSPKIRILVAVLLTVAAGGLFLWFEAGTEDDALRGEVTDAPLTEGRPPLELTSSQECAACHQAIFDEWEASHHAFAWLNPEPRRPELSDNFKNKDCIPCHAPRPMIEVGFGNRALERQSQREDGVNCFTCHQYKNVMAAAGPLTPAAINAPCNPVTWEPVGTVNLCLPCHDQHKVVQNWMASEWAVEGSDNYRDCNDCHMPEVPGPATRGSKLTTHRSHFFGGGNDPETVRQAATLRARRLAAGETFGGAIRALGERSWKGEGSGAKADGDRTVLIEVKNTGAGHNFPEDERHRTVDLLVRFTPRGGAPGERVQLTRFRNPYRHEFELVNPFIDRAGERLEFPVSWNGGTVTTHQVKVLPDYQPLRKVHYPHSTQLLSGESRFVWFELPFEGSGTLEITLLYRKNPYLEDDASVVAAETVLEFDR